MKKVLLTLLAFMPVALLSAQICNPNPDYADSTGVFPMPFSAANPSGGITECAIIDEPFEFVFTVAVGDSITVNFLGQELRLALDSVVVNSVEGLPLGLNYACAPGNCAFPKNSLGCAVINGTPVSSNTPGDYPLVIKGTVFFPGFPFEQDVDFPGDQFPGEYTLQLLPDGMTDCTVTSTNEQLAEKVNLSLSPNPSAGPIQIEINADIFGEFNLRVVDLLGNVVHKQALDISLGNNRVSFDGSALSNGLFIVVLENELGTISQKLLIQH